MNNHVELSKINYKSVEGNDLLREKVRDYFDILYHEDFSWRPKQEGVNFRILDETSRLALEREFS